MNNQSILNLYQTNPTNQDQTIIYTPHENITNYQYTIYKDNETLEQKNIDNNDPLTIILDETGQYQLIITEYDHYGKENQIKSGTYQIDKEKPIIEVTNTRVELKQNQTYNPLENITVHDNMDQEIQNKIITNLESLDLTTPGDQNLKYQVTDAAGNIATKTITLNVQKNTSEQLIFFQISLISLLLLFFIIALLYRRSLKLENRISRYAVQPLKDKSPSLFDNIMTSYHTLVTKLGNHLTKSAFLSKYAIHYEKYINTIGSNYQRGIEFIANKMFISLCFLLVAIISKTIQLEVLGLYEICFPLLCGFFAPDLIYISKYKVYHDRLENDLLQAIIIMNNAFKSGRSITQAIHLVTTELQGPIAEEFKKMHLEIGFGLSIDVVFKRFSERIKIDEATYLTASLSILNKTGGNIIKVFSSIEKSLFSKKKLKLEMDSLTGSSKLIVYVLFIVPLLFILFISILSPGYFNPFFTTPIGRILLIIMLIYYGIYIIAVRKIMKVRM